MRRGIGRFCRFRFWRRSRSPRQSPSRARPGTRKTHGADRHRPGGDDLPHVFSGSLVVRGMGIGEVTATGARSEIGKIGQSLGALEAEPPRLRAQTHRLTMQFAMVGGTVSVL